MDFQIPSLFFSPEELNFHFIESLSFYLFSYFPEIAHSFSRLTKPSAIHIQLRCLMVLFAIDEHWEHTFPIPLFDFPFVRCQVTEG